MNLREITLFERLDDAKLKEIDSFSTLHHLKKEEIVFFEKEPPAHLHILMSGIAKVYKSDKKGKEIVIHHFYPVTMIAELANLESMPFPASCAMESDGSILKVDFAEFKKLLKDSDVCYEMLKSLTKKMKFLDNVILSNIILDTTAKVAKFIYEHDDLFLSLKQHKIASILNIKPETLSRTLKKFKDLGILENENNKIELIDKEKLQTFF